MEKVIQEFRNERRSHPASGSFDLSPNFPSHTFQFFDISQTTKEADANLTTIVYVDHIISIVFFKSI